MSKMTVRNMPGRTRVSKPITSARLTDRWGVKGPYTRGSLPSRLAKIQRDGWEVHDIYLKIATEPRYAYAPGEFHGIAREEWIVVIRKRDLAF